MGAIMAMCVSSQLLQGAANPWLYKHVRLDVSKPHQVTGFTSGITSDKTGYIRTLDIAPDSRVTGTMPSRMLERLVRHLQNLRTFW